MSNGDKSKPLRINGLEDWMEQFFDDPFTNMLDKYSFRVDLFETSNQYIVEAELSGITINQIDAEVSGDNIIIRVSKDRQKTTLERIITLPFSLIDKNIYGTFKNEILEIFISKNGDCKQTTSKICIY